MIIGKNNNLQSKNPFINNTTNTPIADMTRANYHPDVTNKKEMTDKSFAILEDRLNKGLISIEEFNKKCNQLGKRK